MRTLLFNFQRNQKIAFSASFVRFGYRYPSEEWIFFARSGISALCGFSFIHFLSIQLLFDTFSISLRHLFEVLRPPFLLSSVGHEWEMSGTHVGEVTSKSSRNFLEMHSKRWLKGDESPWKRQICECEVADNMRIKVGCIHWKMTKSDHFLPSPLP